MKMSNYLVEIAGVSIYPIISLLIFVAFFTCMLLWVFYMDKNKVNYIAHLPLSEDQDKISKDNKN